MPLTCRPLAAHLPPTCGYGAHAILPMLPNGPRIVYAGYCPTTHSNTNAAKRRANPPIMCGMKTMSEERTSGLQRAERTTLAQPIFVEERSGEKPVEPTTGSTIPNKSALCTPIGAGSHVESCGGGRRAKSDGTSAARSPRTRTPTPPSLMARTVKQKTRSRPSLLSKARGAEP